MKRFVCMVFALILVCSLTLTAKAADADIGSIQIKVEHNNKKITGGDLIAVRVGYTDNDKLIFRRVTDHEEIKNIGESSAVTQMQNFYTANKSTHTFLTYKSQVKDGLAKFTGLPRGLYLIYQDTAAEGYEKLSSFLVTVPYKDKMDVNAASKTSLKKEEKPTTEPTASSGSSGSGSGNKKLPQTGQLIWPIPWMAGSGMVLFVFGWRLFFGRKEDSQ